MRYTISHFESRIKGQELWIYVYAMDEWDYTVDFPFSVLLRLLPDLKPQELELLIGSVLELNEYYMQGETMVNGQIANRSTYLKPPRLVYKKPLQKLREEDGEKLFHFQQIYNAELSNVNNIRPYIKITTSEGKVYFKEKHLFLELVDLKEEKLGLLKGVFVAPVMYRKGETMSETGRFTLVKENNKIVRFFNFRIEGNLEQHKQKYMATTCMFPSLHYKKLYRGNPDNFDNRCNCEKHGGFNSWDDNAIDNAFEGDPDATWNVD